MGSLFSYSPESFFDLSLFPHKGLFEDVEFVWEPLVHLDSYIKKSKLQPIQPHRFSGVYFENPEMIFAHEKIQIEPGAYIKGPCLLEEGCEIRHAAYVRGHVILGKRAVIGHCSEVIRSIFLCDAKAPHFNYVGDSILGNHVNLGAGFITANLKHTKKEICVPGTPKKIRTGLTKLGAIIGDHSMLGCNGVSNPGTFFPKKSSSMPCHSLRGVIA